METILKELKSIESKHHIKILYACESGSRAWGYASRDSDYDIRFIYIQCPQWYLSIDEHKDNMVEKINDSMDVSGWDIRKALKLFRNSNPSLLEWLNAHMVYMEYAPFIKELRKLMPRAFSEKACLHHYFNMARNNMDQWKNGKKHEIKWYFNILRPLLCCKWMEMKHTVPPVLFQELMEILPSGDIHHKMTALLNQRKLGINAKSVSPERAIDDFIDQELLHLEAYLPTIKEMKSDMTPHLNTLYRKTLKEIWRECDLC